MRIRVLVFSLALLPALCYAPPASARVVSFKTAAPLSDHSDGALELAIRSAVEKCVQDATAMGLSWMWLQDAAVTGDSVVVHMMASDEEREGADDVTVIDLVPRPGAAADVPAS